MVALYAVASLSAGLNMLWEIRGWSNGQHVNTSFEAPTADAARNSAAARGIAVTEVLPIQQPQNSTNTGGAPLGYPGAPMVTPGAPAYYAPPGGMPPARIQKSISGLGVASLIIAIFAVLLCWLPLLGMISIPLAMIALLLGFIGLLVSLIGGRS